MTADDPHAHLPPRPDPHTGEPFPPHGAAWLGEERAPEDDPERETRLSRKPTPPKDKGPVLAWHQQNARGKITLFLTSVAFIGGAGSILGLLDGHTLFGWVRYWQVWAVVLVSSLLITRPLTYTRLSAGADWCQMEHVRFGITRRHQVIKLYELRSITIDATPQALYLELADDSSFIELARIEWQPDRRIWDLVYNGILHSVADGATTNHNARGFLQLDSDTTTLDRPAGNREIDLTRLDDVDVWQLMEDPGLRKLCRHNEHYGSARKFRQRFPTVTENMLANPANPEWFTDGASET